MANIKLPENFNSQDKELKKQFHYLADDMNFINNTRKKPLLACGAVRKGKVCKNPAGSGTDHVGYGRCKFHGGRNKGPITEEGKQAASKNSVTHGLYAAVLPQEEREYFNKLAEDKIAGLEFEINMMKAKIIGYLKRQNEKFEKLKAEYGEEAAYSRMRVYFNESDSGARNYYHAGTIEDRPLDRALNTLSRLVEKHSKLTNEEKDDDLLTKVNSELKAASHGQVSISWGGKPQTRAAKGG